MAERRNISRPNEPRFARPHEVVDVANQALELARKDIDGLQANTKGAINQIVEGTGEFGRRLFDSIDAHSQTPEFGKLLWEQARIGESVLELIERQVARRIAEREAQRPHRRAIAFVQRLLGRARS